MGWRRWQKMAIPISGVIESGERTVTVELAGTKERFSARLSDVEFAPGLILIPMWLYERVFLAAAHRAADAGGGSGK